MKTVWPQSFVVKQIPVVAAAAAAAEVVAVVVVAAAAVVPCSQRLQTCGECDGRGGYGTAAAGRNAL